MKFNYLISVGDFKLNIKKKKRLIKINCFFFNIKFHMDSFIRKFSEILKYLGHYVLIFH